MCNGSVPCDIKLFLAADRLNADTAVAAVADLLCGGFDIVCGGCIGSAGVVLGLIIDGCFHFDEIKHIVDLAAAGHCCGAAVDRDVPDADRDHVLFGRLDVEILTLGERADAVVNVVENVDVLVVVGGNQCVHALCCLSLDGILREDDEVCRLIGIEVDDLRRLEIADFRGEDLLHFARVRRQTERAADRQAEFICEHCADRVELRQSGKIRARRSDDVIARLHICFELVDVLRVVLIDKVDDEFAGLRLRGVCLQEPCFGIELQIRDREVRFLCRGCLQRHRIGQSTCRGFLGFLCEEFCK